MRGRSARVRTGALAAAATAAALAAAAGPAGGQVPDRADTGAVAVRLGDPTPNPFQEEVRLPFRLGAPAADTIAPAADASGRGTGPPADSVRVSVAVYNVLYQRVAWARTPEEAGGVPIRDRIYAVPGRYEAVWRGRADGGRRMPSGPYFVELVAGGRTAVRKVLLVR